MEYSKLFKHYSKWIKVLNVDTKKGVYNFQNIKEIVIWLWIEVRYQCGWNGQHYVSRI